MLSVVYEDEPAIALHDPDKFDLLGRRESSAPYEVEAAILMLCDQPFITSSIIRRLVNAYHTRSMLLVASEYETGDEKRRAFRLSSAALSFRSCWG